MSKKPKPCRYCAAGNRATINGEHWIVKTIHPAVITIRKCTEPGKAAEQGLGKGDRLTMVRP